MSGISDRRAGRRGCGRDIASESPWSAYPAGPRRPWPHSIWPLIGASGLASSIADTG
jgi:hypothetical protein